MAVCPTGGGKTEIGTELLSGFANPRWLCHRRDLKEQTLVRLNSACPVESIAKLALGDEQYPGVDLLVVDEAHHAPSDSWLALLGRFPNAKVVGLTATPQRSDGRSLSMFDSMVVAASYSELLALGFLVPCRAFEPRQNIDSGMALSPVEAYLRHTPGKRGFCFVPNVKYAAQVLAEFEQNKVRAAVLHGTTKSDVRKRILAQLESGDLDILINCTALTEGVNIPAAEACILARRCLHPGLYLQICGRILRPYPGKAFGTLLDLVGAVKRHGMPTLDREYSLTGAAIRPSTAIPLRQCYVCGAVMESYHKNCVTCGTAFVAGVHRPPKILNVGLQEVYAGSETPDQAKVNELIRLTETKRWAAAAKMFEELFGRRPTTEEWAQVPQASVKREWRALAQRLTFGQASVIMKSYTGQWVPYNWRNQ